MSRVLDTMRIFEEEDTQVIRTVRLAIPYAEIHGPIEDYTYLYPDYPEITAFRDEVGEVYAVLEPFQKVLDNWLYELEQSAHQVIRFSAQ